MDANSLADSVLYMRIVSYVDAASIAILVFDSLLTFEQEVITIWSKEWNYVRFMYVLTRYSAFLEAGIKIYQLSIPGKRYLECSLAFKANACLFVFGLGVGEILMTTRTWAVWNKNRFFGFALAIFYTVIWACSFIVLGIFLQSVKFDLNPHTQYVGCYATYRNPIIFLNWVLLLFYDTVMFILMAIPAIKAYRLRGRSRFLNVVYGDGVMYYFCLFAMSLANIIITLTSPPDLILVISFLSRMVHAILACRVFLHINEYGRPVLSYHITTSNPSAL